MSNRITVAFASAALVVASAALAFAIHGSAVELTAPVGASTLPAPDAVDVASLANRIDDLERRLATLAARPTGEQRVEAAPITDPATDASEERLVALERAVAALRSELAGLGPMPVTVAGIVEALADKNLQGCGLSPEQTQRRRELLTRFLELAPRDPQAPRILEQLFEDLLAEDARASLAVLDRYEDIVGLPADRKGRLRANGLVQAGDADAGRAIYAHLAGDGSCTEAQRVDAAFWHAHSWKSQGRYDEARREFESLIARYGSDPDPQIVSFVAGARGQIEELDRWQRQR